MEDLLTGYFWIVGVLTVAMAAMGVLWAPVGCLSCGLIAYRRGLRVKLWMGRGLVGSALFLFPWFYVVASVSGLGFSSLLKRAEYALVYLAWMVAPIGLMITLVIGSFVAQWQGTPDSFSEHPAYFSFLIAVTIANLYTWFMSLRTWAWKLRDRSPEFDVSFYRQWLAVIAWLLAFLALLFIFFMIELQEWRQRTM